MFGNILSYTSSRLEQGMTHSTSTTTVNPIQSDICYEIFHETLNSDQNGGRIHRREKKIVICPNCQCQTDLVITSQKKTKSCIIRVTLILTLVLACFAFKPCLLDDLKKYEYKCVNCKQVVYSFKRI